MDSGVHSSAGCGYRYGQSHYSFFGSATIIGLKEGHQTVLCFIQCYYRGDIAWGVKHLLTKIQIRNSIGEYAEWHSERVKFQNCPSDITWSTICIRILSFIILNWIEMHSWHYLKYHLYTDIIIYDIELDWNAADINWSTICTRRLTCRILNGLTCPVDINWSTIFTWISTL